VGTDPPDPSDVVTRDADTSFSVGPSRRQFLTRAAVGGAVLTVGSAATAAVLVPAAAQEDGEEPPARSPQDAIVAHLAGLALAAADGYGIATGDSSPVTEPVRDAIRVFAEHHRSQAAALNGELPEDAPVEAANATLAAELATSLAQTESDAVLSALRTLEQNLAASHFSALGRLDDQQAAGLVARTLPVLTQHAVVLGSLSGVAFDELLIETQTAQGAYTMRDYPMGSGEGEEGEETPPSTDVPDGGEGGTSTTEGSTDDTTATTTGGTAAGG
jgi:hypothetical protein